MNNLLKLLAILIYNIFILLFITFYYLLFIIFINIKIINISNLSICYKCSTVRVILVVDFKTSFYMLQLKALDNIATTSKDISFSRNAQN